MRILTEHGIKNVVAAVPMFWQMQPLIHQACRRIGAGLFTADPGNPPLIAKALEHLGSEALISAEAGHHELSIQLNASGIMPRLWIRIRGFDELGSPSSAIQTGHHISEVHLAPGISVLEQCEDLEGTHNFHLCATAAYEDGTVYCTVAKIQLRRSVTLSEVKVCGCGRIVVSIV